MHRRNFTTQPFVAGGEELEVVINKHINGKKSFGVAAATREDGDRKISINTKIGVATNNLNGCWLVRGRLLRRVQHLIYHLSILF